MSFFELPDGVYDKIKYRHRIERCPEYNKISYKYYGRDWYFNKMKDPIWKIDRYAVREIWRQKAQENPEYWERQRAKDRERLKNPKRRLYNIQKAKYWRLRKKIFNTII